MYRSTTVRLIAAATLTYVAAVPSVSKISLFPIQNGIAARVLFVSNRGDKKTFHIYRMNPDGTGQTDLSKSSASDFDPVWSPDGKQIAFSALNDPQSSKTEIYVMSPDGTQRKKLTQSGAIAFAPTWSPDSKRIAYAIIQSLEGGVPQSVAIYVMDADGSNSKKLGEGILPSWSPDGKRILFTTVRGDNFVPGLSIMDADGSHIKTLVEKLASMGVWSPDGTRIAYLTDGGSGYPDLFVMNADGTKPTQLTKNKGLVFGAQWSADSKRIYYTQMPKNATSTQKASICVIDSDGKNSRQLTNDDAANVVGNGAALLTRRVQ